MIRSNLSSRSRNSFHTFRRHRGFTLVEMMISTLLVAISATLALPSYRDMVEKRQLTNSAEQLASFVNSAQSIAARKNQFVTVSYSRTDNDKWCIGASYTRRLTALGEAECDCADVDAENFCEIDSQPFVMNQSLSGGSELVYAISGDGTYVFDHIRGLFVDTDDALTMGLRSNNQAFRLNLEVNNTGRVTLCSDDASHAIPGYDVCPLGS